MMIDYLSRYFTAFSLLAAFCGGWYSGYTYYDVKQLKIDLNTSNEVIKNKDDVIKTDAQNLKNRDNESILLKNQLDITQNKYYNQLRITADAKDTINANNVITLDLMRKLGAIRAENSKLSKSLTVTGRASTANATISPYEYTQWAIGKNMHDDICVDKFNALQNFYNKQRILINGFKQ